MGLSQGVSWFGTNNVGASAVGTGAKAGAVIGIVAGVLSGGVTLIGGALAGLASGAVLGSLKPKALGLSDGGLELFKAALTGSKAALVVTADDDEVNDTVLRIRGLGGNVVSYMADRDAMDAINSAAVEQERFTRQSGVTGDPTQGVPRPTGF